MTASKAVYILDGAIVPWRVRMSTTPSALVEPSKVNWEVDFANRICIPAGGEYVIMLCPQQGVWGVIGQDASAPHGRSYWAWNPTGCSPQEQSTAEDYMIWSCVTSCGAVPVEGSSWGQIKALYR